MYLSLLVIHSLVRWVVLALLAYLIFKAFTGAKSGTSFADLKKLNAAAIGSVHLQFITGIVLYFFLSPLGVELFEQGMSAVMKNSELRFWAIEHITMMTFAVIVAQVGSILAKKATDNSKALKRIGVFYSVALLLMLSRIPWDRVF